MCKFEVRGTLFPRVPGGEPGKHRAMALSVVAKCVRAETFKKEKALANLARHKKGCADKCYSCLQGSLEEGDTTHNFNAWCGEGQLISDIRKATLEPRDDQPRWVFEKSPALCYEDEIPSNGACQVDVPYVITMLRRRCVGRPYCLLPPEELNRMFGSAFTCGGKVMRLSAILECVQMNVPTQYGLEQKNPRGNRILGVHYETRVAPELRFAPTTVRRCRLTSA